MTPAKIKVIPRMASAAGIAEPHTKCRLAMKTRYRVSAKSGARNSAPAMRNPRDRFRIALPQKRDTTSITTPIPMRKIATTLTLLTKERFLSRNADRNRLYRPLFIIAYLITIVNIKQKLKHRK